MITITARLLHRFEDYLREQEASPHTISKYLRDVRKLRTIEGEKILGKKQLLHYKQHLLEGGYAVRSINSMLSSVNKFLMFCGKMEWKLRLLKVQRSAFSDSQRQMRHADYRALVTQAHKLGKERLELILQTICSTGIRVSELRAITVESLKSGIAEIRSKGKIRQILLPHSLRQMLLAYSRRRGIGAGCVFLTQWGNVPDRSNLWKEMKKLCADAGIAQRRVFPHNLRHLFARSFYQKYRDVVHLADILGHSSIDTTRIYTMKNSRSEVQRLEVLGLLVTHTT